MLQGVLNNETGDDNIVITKVKEKKELTLDDIFKDYDGEYVAEEFDWGSPVGEELPDST